MLLEPEDRRDVGMVEGGEQPRLPFESEQAIPVLGKGIRKDLDRHLAMELRVARPIDLTHPTPSDRGDDLVDADARAGREGH